MGTQKTATKAMPKAQPEMLQIPLATFGEAYDHLMTGTRLVLALHRLEQSRQEGSLKSPEDLICWQAFSSLLSALDELGTAAGYGPDEMEVE